MADPQITLSVVSHRQNALVNSLLEDVQRTCAESVKLVLTDNVPDATPLATQNLSCPLEVITNDRQKGFGGNHNAAFKHCTSPYFCVCNPDIRFSANPFRPLLKVFTDPSVAVAGPLVRSPSGEVEDSARRFPTAWSLLKKLFVDHRRPDYSTDRVPLKVDWLAGMFMLFRSDAYRSVGGFDEAYFLYYEDVDICRRLFEAGNSIIYEPRVEIVHNARRASRRNVGLAVHHLRSAVRFLTRST